MEKLFYFVEWIRKLKYHLGQLAEHFVKEANEEKYPVPYYSKAPPNSP
jgi:hypothetical protein